jgi:hypothetical protein
MGIRIYITAGEKAEWGWEGHALAIHTNTQQQGTYQQPYIHEHTVSRRVNT